MNSIAMGLWKSSVVDFLILLISRQSSNPTSSLRFSNFSYVSKVGQDQKKLLKISFSLTALRISSIFYDLSLMRFYE